MGERTDVGDGGSDTDFDTRVALLSQLALEELVQLGIEDTVGDELAALRNSSLDSSHDCVSAGLLVVEETAEETVIGGAPKLGSRSKSGRF